MPIPAAYERRKDRALALEKRFEKTFSQTLVQDLIAEQQGNPIRENTRFRIDNLMERPSCLPTVTVCPNPDGPLNG